MSEDTPVRIEREAGIGVILVDSPPVNALSVAVRKGLAEAVAELTTDGSVTAIVLACAGRTFIAGADIREFGKPLAPPALTEVIDAIESCPKPVVAAIHGTALGGGLEVALGCHYRIALSSAALGLPEVNLGIIPGAGGTQRLPRLVGFEAAIDIITTTRRVKAAEAVELGLVDLMVDADLVGAAVHFARERAEEGGAHPVTSEIQVPSFSVNDFVKAEISVMKKARGQLSPVKALESIRNVAESSFAEGMRRERKIFEELVASDQSAALRYAFFGEREVAKLPGLDGVEPRTVKNAAIIGAGTMGTGISVAFANAGFPVTVIETSDEALAAGRARIEAVFEEGVKRGKLSPEKKAARLGQYTFATDLAAAADADLVIEAVFEDMAVKKDLFARLDAIAKPGAVLATNTSYLDVNEIAAATGRPESVLGLHFFSPANLMRLLEVVRAAATGPDVLATAMAVAKKLGKIAVVAGVCDGFIGNRILTAYKKQADYLVEEGAWPEDVDRAMTDYGYPMGPFAVSDLAGLDISWANRKRLAASRDPRARYVDIPDRLCELGRFGRKTGAGWYDYSENRNGAPDPAVHAIIEAASRDKGITRRDIGADEIRSRILAAMVNEAADILAEGIAARPVDVDMVMLAGYGFPRWRGGPLFEADRRGLEVVLKEVNTACAAGGFGWRPAPLLVELAKSGRRFADLAG